MPPEDSLHIIEEARRLGIISFGSGGFDRPVDSFRFGDNGTCFSFVLFVDIMLRSACFSST